jgi:hypothetical protein
MTARNQIYESTPSADGQALPASAGSASLASRCYESTQVEDELFEKVNAVLGCVTENCLKEGFVWGATDTWWDEYDGSVEVVRPLEAQWMSREEANAILDFGFGCIYESIGDKARLWSRKGYGECSPRDGDEVRRLRATVAALRKPNIKDDSLR